MKTANTKGNGDGSFVYIVSKQKGAYKSKNKTTTKKTNIENM